MTRARGPFLSTETKTEHAFDLSYDKHPKSVCQLGSNRYRVVTDRRTDRITIASTRLALRAVARTKPLNFCNFRTARWDLHGPL